jgi:hypothetical protein
MGQQQLILLVLATVIVGLAIVVGVRAFTENAVKANYDALVHDAMRISSDANAWKQKPTTFGGQATAEKKPGDWTGINFTVLGYTPGAAEGATPTCYANANGSFEVTPADGRIIARNGPNRNLVTIQLPTATDPSARLLTANSKLGNAAAEEVATPDGCFDSDAPIAAN